MTALTPAHGEERRTAEYHVGATASSLSWTVEVGTVSVLEARELTSSNAHLFGGSVVHLKDDNARFWVVSVKVINRRRDVPTVRLHSNWFFLDVPNAAGASTVLTPSGIKDFPGHTMWMDLAQGRSTSLDLLYVVAGAPKDMVLDFVDVRIPLLRAGFPVRGSRTPAEATAFSRLVQHVKAGLTAPDADWNPAALRARLRETDVAQATAVVMHEGHWEIRLRGIELLREIADRTAVQTLIGAHARERRPRDPISRPRGRVTMIWIFSPTVRYRHVGMVMGGAPHCDLEHHASQ